MNHISKIKPLIILMLLMSCSSSERTTTPHGSDQGDQSNDSQGDPENGEEEGGEEGSSLPEPYTGGASLDLGNGLIFEGISNITVVYYESDGSICSRPNSIWLEYGDSQNFPQLHLSIPFEGSPAVEASVDTEIAGSVGSGEEDSGGTWDTQLTIVTADSVFRASSGLIHSSVDTLKGTASFVLSGVQFEDYGKESVIYGGSVTADLHAYCAPVTYESDGEGGHNCVWLNEQVPYTSSFCTKTMAEYPADVLR